MSRCIPRAIDALLSRPGRPARAGGRVIFGLLVVAFIAGLGLLAAFVPLGHGFIPKGGGWFIPEVVGGPFTLHPLLIAVPSAACFVLGLLDWRHPWRVEHLDLLALAGFFPVAMLLSDDISPAGLGLAAVCLGWLFVRMLGASFGRWPMPQLRPSISSGRLRAAIGILLLIRLGSVAAGNILDVGQASSLGAWRLLHGQQLYGAVSWQSPGGLRIYRPDSYGPFAYYAYIPFVAVFPPAPSLIATLLPAACFDVLTLAGLHKLGSRLGGRPLAQAFMFAYLLYAFTDLTLMAETNDALIATVCVWTIVAVERPVVRGLLIAAAALTKFAPAVLAFQFLAVKRGRSRYALTLVASLAGMLAWPLITSGAAQFLDSTFGYQLIQRGGGTQFSIWTYLPHVATLARPAARNRPGAASDLTDVASCGTGRAAARRSRRCTAHRRTATTRLLVLQLRHLVLPAPPRRGHPTSTGAPNARMLANGAGRVDPPAPACGSESIWSINAH